MENRVEITSILYNLEDEYELSVYEYNTLYHNFVTYSPIPDTCLKGKNIGKFKMKDIKNIFPLYDKDLFIFVKRDCFKEGYIKLGLDDYPNCKFEKECGITCKPQQSKPLFIIKKIRNCLAHGRFILKFNTQGQKLVIMEDAYNKKVSGRFVFKLDTLISLANLIYKYQNKEEV